MGEADENSFGPPDVAEPIRERCVLRGETAPDGALARELGAMGLL